MPCHHRVLRSGFTLLSMIITLFIVGLLLIVTISYGEATRRNLTISTALQEIAQKYEEKHHQAVAEGVNYYVIFNKDRVRYYRRGISNSDTFEEIIFPEDFSTDRSHKIHIHGGTGHVDPKTITFYAGGTRYHLIFQLGGQYDITEY